MKHYLRLSTVQTHYSLRHNFALFFQRVEFLFFCVLSAAFILASVFNQNFSNRVSQFFVDISLPVVHSASLPFNVAIDLLTNFQELVDAKNKNALLRAENEELKLFYANSLHIHNENKELRKTLQFISPKASEYKVANVNGRAHKIFNQSVYIDAGRNIGIKEGSLVAGNHGAIGRIVEVFDNKSRVILATNADSRIPIITSNARVRGVLAGNNSDVMKILYLQKNHTIKVGDRVFTSGDGDALPSGFLIGVVSEVGEAYAAVKLVENVNDTNVVTITDYSLSHLNPVLEEVVEKEKVPVETKEEQ